MKKGKYIFFDFSLYLVIWLIMALVFEDYSIQKLIIYAVGQSLVFTIVFSLIGRPFSQTLAERRKNKKSQQ